MTIPDTRPTDLSQPCSHPFIGCPCRQPGDATLNPAKADPQASFVLGFASWALAEPDRIGLPMEDERGGIPGFSVQRTSKGRLMACNLIGLGWRLTFWNDADGSRWLFRGDHSEQIA